jgi:hypothetical protein
MRLGRTLNFAAAAGLAVVLLAMPQGALAQRGSDNPLTKLEGNWSGNGTITLKDGSSERIRCRASYKAGGGGGGETQINLRCASDSYKFELSSQVAYRDGQISGNWNETTRNAAGQISGTATPSKIDVRALGQTFAALITISVRSDSQSVSIRSPGSTMQEVAISLARQ